MSTVATTTEERRLQGTGVSPGIARGTVFVYRPDDEAAPSRRIEESEIPAEIARFEAALLATRAQILEMQQRIAESTGAKDAGIFDAHLLVVEDRTLIDEVLRRLAADKMNIEHVFQSVAGRYAKTLSEIDDPYLRERALDIHDVTRRIIHNLMGKEARDLSGMSTPHILIAHNLAPSDTAQLNRALVLAFGTDAGSKTSHTAIMARSLSIPAIVGLHDASLQLATGDHVLLDGYNGLLIVHPSDQTLWEYGELEIKKTVVEETLSQLRETASTTRDGRHVAEAAAPHSIIIRTLDLGGDKFMSTLHMPEELNPFLGWRAIRFCLERVDIFKTQLRAILRASAAGSVKMMYPMISGVDELRRANVILEECRAELRAEGVPFSETMEVGAMIEIPSAAISADILAKEVDFFSIGTNDLIQYSIAVDRLNEHIAHLYEPTHPAIIRLIRMTVDAAHANELWVGVCGEMAGDIVLTPLLLGLGVDELSAGAGSVPRVKRAVQSLDNAACRQLVEDILHLDSAADILAKCDAVARAHYPELL